MEEKIKFSGRKKSDYLKKNINNEYCFQKCTQFFPLWKSSMDRYWERACGGKRVIRGITLFSFSIGHWLASSNLIWKEEKKHWNVFLWIQGILLSIKWIVIQSWSCCKSICSISRAWIVHFIELYVICGKITSLERPNCNHSIQPTAYTLMHFAIGFFDE